MKKGTIKNIENSQLFVKEMVGEKILPDGRVAQVVKESLATSEVNLGSVKKPNKNILSIKYFVPPDDK